MPRKTLEPLTEEEKFKLQEQQEHELQRLQREYKILEKDRQLVLCDVKLGRLNKVLSIFQREHENIEKDLGVAGASSKKRQDAKDSKYLSELLEFYDFYIDQVKNERQHIQEIEKHKMKVEKEVVRLRSMQITDKQYEERICDAMRTVSTLENKLDVQNKKFGTICAENRTMKREITRMLWERDVFMKIWNQMINKLVLGKKFMMDLIEQATIAYDQREECVSKLQALRIKAHGDFILHTQEMRELRRKQDNNKKLEHFFNLKGQKRVMRDLQEKYKMKMIENKIKTKERLSEYKQFMNDILEFTRQTEVKEIARRYYKQETENFSLFNHINMLMEELESLNHDLSLLHNEIDDDRRLDDARIKHQNDTIENLETEVEVATADLGQTEKELENVEAYIQKMLSGIDQLFKMCRCDADPILQLLGDNTNINVYNVFLYIEMIEKRIHTAMIEIYYFEKSQFDKKKITDAQRLIADDRNKRELMPLESAAATTPCPLCVEHEIVSDVIDCVQQVMDRVEVKKVLVEHLEMPEFADHLHNVSNCFLPESREIMQRRYQ